MLICASLQAKKHISVRLVKFQIHPKYNGAGFSSGVYEEATNGVRTLNLFIEQNFGYVRT